MYSVRRRHATQALVINILCNECELICVNLAVPRAVMQPQVREAKVTLKSPSDSHQRLAAEEY